VPVYLKSAEHGWIPALQLKTFQGDKATVAVLRIVQESDLLDCCSHDPSSKKFRFDNQIIHLSDYKDGVLPLQNVDHRGTLEDYKDMVDLPFMHEVRSSPPLPSLLGWRCVVDWRPVLVVQDPPKHIVPYIHPSFFFDARPRFCTI
jgi:hypothetical protein